MQAATHQGQPQGVPLAHRSRGRPRVALPSWFIQGDARVVEDDVHEGWERLLPLWRAKEPAIDFFSKRRFGIPLFFERSVIEISASSAVAGGRSGRWAPTAIP